MIITENQLDGWVRTDSTKAQGVIVELVWRLVAASCPRPKERRFPLGDSVGQPGPDGVLDTDFDFNPFVPVGRSYWEIGTGDKAGDKATSDYKKLTIEIPEETRKLSKFIFVTPLSGRRGWQYTWKPKSQATWIRKRREKNEWRDVDVIDGSKLIDWLHHLPAVERWLACTMGLQAHQIETSEERWVELRNIGDPPPLIPDIFLANRDEACNKLKDVFAGNAIWLKVDTHFPAEMSDFVSAYIATLDDNTKIDVVGRCLFVGSTDAWNGVVSVRERHVLVADFDLDDTESSGMRLLERAKRAGHAVIFGGMPGGIPNPNRVSMPSPKVYQVKEALEKAGYKEERARILAQKSNGNLSSLLRCLQNLSLMPEWAQGTDAADLAIAELLGAWSESSAVDKIVVEKLSKKTYGEWIRSLREIVNRPAAPLIQRDGVWKLVARYDGWYSLGLKLFDDDLDRLREVAVMVLCERDPQFDLPPDERYAAGIHGKVLAHSHLLRKGLAESLALLGSHPKALASCSFGKAEATARLSVREILSQADWVLWASLNAVLPILAEAAPSEFLETVESALQSDPCPFDTVFKQEGGGLTGSTYMTGLLWALETLAWDEAYLTRVVVTLGELAARDPGGNWANRPANSLSTILLPWLPQTCAPIEKRQTAVATLLKEVPAVAWKLLLSLLPSSHEVSHGSHKPTWREMIPDDWSRGVTYKEYWEQVASYAELAITTAKQDTSKLTELIDRLPDLPHPASDQVLAHLQSKTVLEMPEQDRLPLWIELVDLVTKHRRYADAQWAMKPDVVKEIENVAEQLAPGAIFRHQRLFSDRDFELYDEKGNYDEQSKDLEKRREDAVNEVIAAGGLDGVLDFAKTVQSAWRVGFAFGMIAGVEFDKQVLPTLIKSQAKSLEQFSGGFVWGRFRGKDWAWVDSVDTSSWSSSDKGQFLAYLPFTPKAWLRAAQMLQQDEKEYWSRASVNPYQTDESLEIAVDRLIEYGRPHAAIQCLAKMREDNQTLKSQQSVRALKAALNSSEDPHSMNADAIVGLINAMQENPSSSPEDLFQVEWSYLPLLDGHRGGAPKALEQRLADDPAFYCEVIQLVYRSEKEELNPEGLTEERKAMVTNAYALLRHWRTPPGHQRDGTFSGEACNAWLEKVKEICKESGHLGVALTNIGHVFVYAPSDADGLWLHGSVASALNAKDVDDMRNGFKTELFNLRGVFSWSAGKEERKLAEKYRKQSDEVEARGYHRVASSLRELAASYERDAEREASRDPYGD